MQGKIQETPKQVSFKQAISDFFRGYYDFKGKSTRAGYWYMFLFNAIIGFVIGFMTSLIGNLFPTATIVTKIFAILLAIYYLIICIPQIALSVRRLHDAGFTVTVAIIILVAMMILNICFILFQPWINVILLIALIVLYTLPTNCITYTKK